MRGLNLVGRYYLMLLAFENDPVGMLQLCVPGGRLNPHPF